MQNSNNKRCPNPPQATQQPLSEQNINIRIQNINLYTKLKTFLLRKI